MVGNYCFSSLSVSYFSKCILSFDAFAAGKPLIISHNGASGVYPDCTDLSYQQAVTDGADYIDCPVQVTKDGILICMSSINLMEVTTVTTSPFSSLSSVIPEIHDGPGIFTFNLTWEEIQKNLKRMLTQPYAYCHFCENMKYIKNSKSQYLQDFNFFASIRCCTVIFSMYLLCLLCCFFF